MELQVTIWYEQGKLQEAMSEVFRASDSYEKFGAAMDVEDCRTLLMEIKRAMKSRSISNNLGSIGRLLNGFFFLRILTFPLPSGWHTARNLGL